MHFILFITFTNYLQEILMKKIYRRITVKSLQEMKDSGEKISMLTSYDYTTAGIVDKESLYYELTFLKEIVPLEPQLSKLFFLFFLYGL